jgi:hypothetical protein
VRAEVEGELLQAAGHQHAVEFGRTCRRLLAERDQDAAMTAEDRRKARRSTRLWQTEDGFQALSGQWSGADGEIVATGVQAFRRPDAPGERRTPEQATADAVVAMAAAALRAAEAPTVHGVRPHVTVTIDYEDTLRRAGVAETRWSGPLPMEEVRRLLADCGVSRLLVDPRGVALEAGEEVRNVPVGVARVIAQRDPVCIADGCDMPADWCQIMHLETPFVFGGRLSPGMGAHGCPFHHQKFDRRGWVVSWVGDRPILHHPERIPEAVQNADPAEVRVVRSGLPGGPHTGDPETSPDADRVVPGGSGIPAPGEPQNRDGLGVGKRSSDRGRDVEPDPPPGRGRLSGDRARQAPQQRARSTEQHRLLDSGSDLPGCPDGAERAPP